MHSHSECSSPYLFKTSSSQTFLGCPLWFPDLMPSSIYSAPCFLKWSYYINSPCCITWIIHFIQSRCHLICSLILWMIILNVQQYSRTVIQKQWHLYTLIIFSSSIHWQTSLSTLTLCHFLLCDSLYLSFIKKQREWVMVNVFSFSEVTRALVGKWSVKNQIEYTVYLGSGSEEVDLKFYNSWFCIINSRLNFLFILPVMYWACYTV